MASGVKVSDKLIQEVHNFKLGKLDKPYKWMIIGFKPNINAAEYLEVEEKGVGPYDELRLKLKGRKDGCYAIADIPLSTTGSKSQTKLVLITWAPDASGPKPKMMVASTLNGFKSRIEGLETHHQACEEADLELDAIRHKLGRK